MTTKPNTIPANNRCGTCWHMRIQKGAHVGRCLLRQETVHETMPNCELYKNRAREAKRRAERRAPRPDAKGAQRPAPGTIAAFAGRADRAGRAMYADGHCELSRDA